MRNGRMNDPLFTTGDAVLLGGKKPAEICGPKQSGIEGLLESCSGGGQPVGPGWLKKGAKKNSSKGGLPRVSPSNCPNKRSWKIPYPARTEVVPRLKGSQAIPMRGSKSCQSLL